MTYRICNAEPVSWNFDGSVATVSERPDWAECEELPTESTDIVEVSGVSVQGHGTRVFCTVDANGSRGNWMTAEEVGPSMPPESEKANA